MPTSVFLGRGDVNGPASSTAGNRAVFADTTGKVLSDGGAPGTLPASTVPAGTGSGLAGVGGTLTTSATPASTGANTDETDLWTYTLPANSLSANTQTLDIFAYAQTAANGNTKTFRLYFGGVAIGARATSTSGDIVAIKATITRTGAATQIALAFEIRSAAGWATTFSTLTSDLTTALVIKATGQNGTANAGDITFRFATVQYSRAGS